MPVFLYNTLSRTKQEFTPIEPYEAGMYVCGPTVYNYAHVGNLRAYIFSDTLRRMLELAGFKVKHVMNITDVGHLASDADEGEDKIEAGAKRDGKSAHEIARFYANAFFGDFSSINCLCPTIICEATQHIPEMQRLIKKLEDKGFTYRISDGIYFDTSKFPSYGELAGRSHIDGLRKGARVEFNREKRNPADFALWKFSPAGIKRQQEWDSPWGTGFPGWHIECSAMSMKYLGETFDIHCGGVDHIAVHHTNEIAQAEAATGTQFVKFWMHNDFLVMSGTEKMAKSAGNFVTLKTLEDKGYEPLAYRYLCLGAHYRTQLEFSWKALDFASKSLSTMRENIWKLQDEFGDVRCGDGRNADNIIPFQEKFINAVTDDLNAPQALAVLWDVLRNAALSGVEKLAFTKYADKVLGLDLLSPRKEEKLSEELMLLVNAREQARKDKDFKKADELRKKLLENNVVLEDTPAGPRWKFIKK